MNNKLMAVIALLMMPYEPNSILAALLVACVFCLAVTDISFAAANAAYDMADDERAAQLDKLGLTSWIVMILVFTPSAFGLLLSHL